MAIVSLLFIAREMDREPSGIDYLGSYAGPLSQSIEFIGGIQRCLREGDELGKAANIHAYG